MDKRKILIQIDGDPQPSAFDRVVAIDAGAEDVFSYGGVKSEQVRELVHGAIFTRGPKDLKNTAIFIGGRDVALAETLLEEAKRHLLPKFGLSVSIMLDPNGANTTAAAAVRVAAEQVKLDSARVTVLGGSGPVGQRIALLLARHQTRIRLTSLTVEEAQRACEAVARRIPGASLEPFAPSSPEQIQEIVAGSELIIAAGAAGVRLLPLSVRQRLTGLKLIIDLNAVPPSGIEGVEVGDNGVDRQGDLAFGAIAVGQRKMKIHQAAIRRLFEKNDLILDLEEVFTLA